MQTDAESRPFSSSGSLFFYFDTEGNVEMPPKNYRQEFFCTNCKYHMDDKEKLRHLSWLSFFGQTFHPLASILSEVNFEWRLVLV